MKLQKRKNVSIKFYGTSWCGDCYRSRQFLKENDVDYEYHDIDQEPEAAEYVEKINGGLKSVPVIVFPNGSVLVEPNNQELAKEVLKNFNNKASKKVGDPYSQRKKR